VDERRDVREGRGDTPYAGDQDRTSSADRLVARLAELRGQLEFLAPQDQERGREAIERIREVQERIETLEELLARAHEREHELTTQAVRDRARILEFEARISELSAIAAHVSRAEEAQRRAETLAMDRDRASTLAQAEFAAQRAEIDRLRSRNSELEADLASVAEEIAAAAVARAEAARLRVERDEARGRAHAERRLAAEDRLRAVEADLRATELQNQLRTAERRIVRITNEKREPATPPAGVETAAETPPWIELQRVSSEATPEGSSAPGGSRASEATVARVGEKADPEKSTSDVEPIIEAETTRADASSVSSEPAPSTRGSSSASEPVTSSASQPDLWIPSEPELWGPSAASAPSGEEPPHEGPAVIDLTATENEATDDDEEPDEAMGSGSRPDPSGKGASPNDSLWQILRGRRRN
jgi:hypothetical protein